RMARRTRTFADASLGDVLRRIASDHGLQADVSASGETYKLLAQVNQSDLAFARDLARREDAQVWVEGTTLKANQRARRQAGTLKGVGKLFQGEYTVTDVAIRYDAAIGLRTEFMCDRPAIGRP